MHSYSVSMFVFNITLSYVKHWEEKKEFLNTDNYRYIEKSENTVESLSKRKTIR